MSRILQAFLNYIAGLVADRRFYTRLQVGSALALVAGLVFATLLLSGLLNPYQARFADLLYQPHMTSGQVVIVQLDEAGLVKTGGWPLTRATLAELLGALARAKPRVIALNIALTDLLNEDDSLTKMIEEIPQIVLPIPIVDNDSPVLLTPLAAGEERVISPDLPGPNMHLAHTKVVKDADGVVRRVQIAIQVSGRAYPALGIASIEASDKKTLTIHLPDGPVLFSGAALPVDAMRQMYLSFFRYDRSEIVPFADVLNNRVDPARLQDRIVLIGMGPDSVSEHYRIPLTHEGQLTSSAEIQASLIDTILTGRFLKEQDPLMQITIIFLLALLTGATLPHFRLLTAAGLTILYLLMYIGYAFAQFQNGILVQPLYPTLALFLTFTLTMGFRYMAENRQRDVVEQLFRRHVSPDAVSQVLSVFDRGLLPLTGVRKEISLLHIDLHSLAGLTELLAPETLVSLTNDYLSCIVQIIHKHAGTVLKKAGTSVVAIWNLPIPSSDHSQRAVLAATEIRQELAECVQKDDKRLEVHIGMGISTGQVVAGYIGDAGYSEYAIVGVVAAIAERLAANSACAILVDAPTLERLEQDVQTCEAKPMRVRGKPELYPTWQVLVPREPGTVESPGTALIQEI